MNLCCDCIWFKGFSIEYGRSAFQITRDLTGLFEKPICFYLISKMHKMNTPEKTKISSINCDDIHQPLRSSRIWHKVNF